MPYCPNCGDQAKEEHYYCGGCGFSLADETRDDSEGIPPSGTAAGRHGFLSGRSLQYLHRLMNDEDIDRETAEYSILSRDIGAALADFAIVATVDDINLLALMADQRSETDDLFEKGADELNKWQKRERLMWMGFYRIPELYDRLFLTEWSDELSEVMMKIAENADKLGES